jgi:plastocyanin
VDYSDSKCSLPVAVAKQDLTSSLFIQYLLNKRSLIAVLGLVSIVIGIVSIFVLSTLAATVVLPLTDAGMIEKAKTLPEVKAFVNKYPNYSIAAANSTSSNADGYVEYRIGSWAAEDKTRHGYMKFDNTIHLTVLFNRASGEIVEKSIECEASLFRFEFGRTTQSKDDPSKTYYYTSADKDILEFIEQGRAERCLKKSDTSIVQVMIQKDARWPDSGKGFEPAIITVVMGINNTVQWINQDVSGHFIEADNTNSEWFSEATRRSVDLSSENVLSRGENFTLTFIETGEFEYHSRPWNRGKVIVVP